MFSFLNGYKTYIVAVGGIVAAVVAYVNGSIGDTGLLQAILTAVLGAALRHGIANQPAA